MAEPKGEKDKREGNLSEGAKTHLVDIYVSNKYGRNTNIQTKYTSKGLMVEEDSITLYSRLKKRFFKKNIEAISNSMIKGTPDFYIGESIRNAEEIIDAKSSWDIFTFFRVVTKPINPDYWWQMQGYMALSGASCATLAYCLIDTPETLINDEKRRLLYQMGVATEENNDYQEACLELDKLMRYGDIPIEERMIEFKIERDNEAIARLYAKVLKARDYLNQIEYERFGFMPEEKKVDTDFDPTSILLTKIK